jgi:hypothetical protein
MAYNRRDFLKSASAVSIWSLTGCFSPILAYAQNEERSIDDWMKEWMEKTKAAHGRLHLTRFVEPIYVLTRPISWIPNENQKSRYSRVDVPAGFVTDFASIPRAFWSLLQPDGEYTYPAIVHDYLYWTQDRPRKQSDRILKFGMEDFRIDPAVIRIIYGGVRIGGELAWQDNAKLKQAGEKRVIKLDMLPDDPTIRWEDMKKRKDIFR